MFADAGTHEPVGQGDDRGQWCGQCGEALGDGGHSRCAQRAELEPPRFCVRCRRRMKVQVTPGTWTATCIEHGSVERSTWA